MAKEIPWPRVAIEGVVIVASILLAFGVDAWWDGVQQRSEEQEILSALRRDFVGNLELLDQVIETHLVSSGIFQAFYASGEPIDTSSQDRMEAVLTALYGSRTFDPFHGTLEATISSGKLDLIRDPSLRTALAAWGRATSDLVENATQVRSSAERVRESLEGYGGPFRGPGPPRESVLGSIDGSTLAQIREDESVAGRARTKQFALEIYLVELIQLRSMAEQVVTLIDLNAE